MINIKAFESAHYKYPNSEMPFLYELRKNAKEKRMYKGIKILQNIPLTIEAVLKIEPLVLGGAEVTVSCLSTLPPCKEAIAILNAAGVKVQIDHKFSGTFDICLDCCAELINLTPKIGTIELTQTGSELYMRKENLSYPIVSVDDSKLKYLETLLGTGNGFLRALIANIKEEIYDKKFVVFGYGKVGRGIVYALLKYTDAIAVIDPNKDARERAEKKGLKAIDGNNTKQLKETIQDAYCVVTATGVKGILSKHYRLSKVDLNNAYLANMGAEDEYGANFNEEDVLFAKNPLNFSIPEPTTMKYLDPILYAHNIAIDFLLSTKLKPGYHPFPEMQAANILQKWIHYHKENIFDITEI